MSDQEQEEGERLLSQRRAAAWRAIVLGLNDIARSPELSGWLVRDAATFVMTIRDLVERIDPQSTFEDAMIGLEAEFRAARARVQHAARNEAREWVRAEWSANKSHYNSKKDFACIYAGRLKNERDLIVGYREITDRWLKGL